MKQIKYILLFTLLALLTAACEPQEVTEQGYIEGNYTYVTSQVSGVLNNLIAKRGMSITAGQLLFKLAPDPQLHKKIQTEEQLKQTQAALENLLKGRRPPELAVIEAQKRQAEANLIYAKKTVERYQYLINKGVIDKAALDAAIANCATYEQKIAEAKAQLAAANLTVGRPDEINAAKANVAATNALLKQIDWELQQKSIYAPVSGKVFDTYYRIGEVVNSQQPVLSLLEPRNIFVVFYVTEEHLASLKLGQKISFTYDGAAAPINATIRFISPTAEFTPPVIYSDKTRSKLVFRIEATLSTEDAEKLHPGQPIIVRMING